MTHDTTVRPGRGWNESRRTGLPVESNYIVECTCGYRSNCCTVDPKFAERTAAEHRHRAHWREETT